MAKAYRFTTHIPGFEAWIEYQVSNLRILSANWIVPAGVTAHAFIWENGVLVVDRVMTGTDNTVVAGNYRMTEGVGEFGETILLLPPELDYRFECD